MDKFTDEGKEELQILQFEKPKDYKLFGEAVFETFKNRKYLLKDEHKNDKISSEQWGDWIYKANKNIDKLYKGDEDYKNFREGFKEKQMEKQGKGKGKGKRQLDPEFSGSGITPRSTYHDSQICPDSIVRDVSRLEVLMGGRLAGNNSFEVINEAADIAQRLFQNKIIDLHTYREFVDDLMDHQGYYSD